MKKVLAVLLCLVMVFAMTACGDDDGGSADGEVYKISYAGTVADTTSMMIRMNEAATKMNELSGGRLQMTVYPNNQLGDSVSNFQQMQENGSVQMHYPASQICIPHIPCRSCSAAKNKLLNISIIPSRRRLLLTSSARIQALELSVGTTMMQEPSPTQNMLLRSLQIWKD